jgi:hypothetical protein
MKRIREGRASPNFFAPNPLKSPKTAKEKFGKAWPACCGAIDKKEIFLTKSLAERRFLRVPRIFQIFAGGGDAGVDEASASLSSPGAQPRAAPFRLLRFARDDEYAASPSTRISYLSLVPSAGPSAAARPLLRYGAMPRRASSSARSFIGSPAWPRTHFQ